MENLAGDLLLGLQSVKLTSSSSLLPFNKYMELPSHPWNKGLSQSNDCTGIFHFVVTEVSNERKGEKKGRKKKERKKKERKKERKKKG